MFLPTEAEALTWLSSQFQAETSELLDRTCDEFGVSTTSIKTSQQGLSEHEKFLTSILAFIVVVHLWKFFLSLKRERTIQQVGF